MVFPIAAAVIGGTSLLSGILGSSAASKAAQLQYQAQMAAVEEQRAAREQMTQQLSPYVSTGTGALTAQANLMGLNGDTAQQSAIDAIQGGSTFQALMQQGSNAITQNASATGGLRGGNTQAALAQFAPNLLNNLIQQQYTNLSGLSTLGQNSAAQTGAAGMTAAGNIGNLLTSGATSAGNAYLASAGQWQGALQSGLTALQAAKVF